MKMLSPEQEEVLLGTMLGDGCLEKNGRYARLRIDHCEEQKHFVEWKYKIFRNLVSKKPRQVECFDTRTKKTYYHRRFATLSLEVFEFYRKMFYDGTRKQVPFDLSSLLKSFRSLAVWYMDDGYRRSDCRALYLCTSSFTLDEQYLLKTCLASNFNVNTRIHWAGGNARLYVPAKEAEHFCEMVRPYILKSMSYKLL